jgi:hypothetical protein
MLKTKIKLVEEGKSRIFADWSRHAGVTKEQFIEGLKWVCSDPCDGSTGGHPGRLTRELGCHPERGLVKIKRQYDETGGVVFYEIETGQLWSKLGTASISARDKI